MAFGLTPAGFNRKRLTDIKEEIEIALKLAFSDNIDLAPDSGFGQLVGIMSEALADQNESQENVYNSEYPSTASGAALSSVVQFNGIIRLEETKSITTITITGTPGTVIPVGSKAAVVSTGEKFITDSEVTIPGGGSIDVACTAENFGVISAAAGTIIVIDTPIFGWAAVTNAADAAPGREEETDAALRERRVLSTITLGQNLVDSLFGQLRNIDGVTDARVISNGTDAVDANGIPAHQFLSVVAGGAAADIAQAIWKNTPQGILSYGALTEVITDDQGFPQDVKFSRPTDVDIYFKVDVTTDASFPGTGSADIKAALVAYGEANFGIGEDVIRSEFYTPINETPGITSIDLRIGLAPSPSGTANPVIAIDEISAYDISQVEVNLV